MRCIYCDIYLVGHPEVVSIPGQGLAHHNCFITAQFRSRRFRGLDIKELSDDCLAQLRELVLTETNERNRAGPASDPDSAIELF